MAHLRPPLQFIDVILLSAIKSDLSLCSPSPAWKKILPWICTWTYNTLDFGVFTSHLTFDVVSEPNLCELLVCRQRHQLLFQDYHSFCQWLGSKLININLQSLLLVSDSVTWNKITLKVHLKTPNFLLSEVQTSFSRSFGWVLLQNWSIMFSAVFRCVFKIPVFFIEPELSLHFISQRVSYRTMNCLT